MQDCRMTELSGVERSSHFAVHSLIRYPLRFELDDCLWQQYPLPRQTDGILRFLHSDSRRTICAV